MTVLAEAPLLVTVGHGEQINNCSCFVTPTHACMFTRSAKYWTLQKKHLVDIIMPYRSGRIKK